LAAAVLIIITIGVFVIQSEPQSFGGFAMGSVFNGAIWEIGLPFPGLSGDFTVWMQAKEAELLAMTEAPALALEVAEASGGAFSPHLGAVSALWNIDSKDGTPPRVPSQEEIEQALQEKALDLGAYGKGAACDKALQIIASTFDVPAGVFDLGGNIVTYGKKPFWQPFKIALRDPKGGVNDVLGMFTLKGIHFISTSGSYEKYFEEDGKRYHHIFDPKTGYPAETEGLISVTVVTGYNTARNGGALGDMLSTACFVLGYDDSQELLRKYGADAIFIYESGWLRAPIRVRDYFALENPNYYWRDE